jgi:predicted nucleic-acid-binding protein
MPRAADTNIIVRLIVQDDQDQFEMALDRAVFGLWVSNIVLLEVAWVLQYRYGKTPPEVCAGLEVVLLNPDVVMESLDIARAAVTTARANPAIGFADAFILETARKAGMGPLLTFDDDLSKVDGAELVIKRTERILT